MNHDIIHGQLCTITDNVSSYTTYNTRLQINLLPATKSLPLWSLTDIKELGHGEILTVI